jgi:two-component system, OmpR family, response regulator VicR
MATILYVEDEATLGKMIKEAMERKSYEVIYATDGNEALQLFQNTVPDICVLDVMLPGMDGFTLAGKIREKNKNIPILFLTARSQTSDVVSGFESGGNDYLKKPFSVEELFLRIKELLSRNTRAITAQEMPATDPQEYKIGHYTFNAATQSLKKDNNAVKLSFKESSLLKALVQHKNDVLPRKETLMELWGDDNFFNARNMDVYIARLRKYLSEDAAISIVNIRGFGFKLIVENA